MTTESIPKEWQELSHFATYSTLIVKFKSGRIEPESYIIASPPGPNLLVTSRDNLPVIYASRILGAVAISAPPRPLEKTPLLVINNTGYYEEPTKEELEKHV